MHEQVQFSTSSRLPISASCHHRSKAPGDNPRRIAALVEGIASSEDEGIKIRRACRLAKAETGNPIAFSTLLQILTSAESESIRRRAADNLKKILLDKHMPKLIVSLKNCWNDEVSEYNFEQCRHSYKLLWHCAEKMTYSEFYKAWDQEVAISNYFNFTHNLNKNT